MHPPSATASNVERQYAMAAATNLHPVVPHTALKDAALYFDRFTPYFALDRIDGADVAWLESLLQGRMGRTKEEFRSSLARFVPEHFMVGVSPELLLSMLPEGTQATYRLLLESQCSHAMSVVLARSIDDCEPNERASIIEGLQLTQGLVSAFASDLGLPRAPLMSISAEPFDQDDAQHEQIDPVLTVSNLRLVDTSQASWDQIFEIRSDRDAVRKLRKLRSYIRRDYSGKSKQFVEDDLLSKVADYEEEARRQGLQLIDAAYSVMSESPGLLAIMAAALALNPTAVSAALLAGGVAVAQIGKVAIRIAKASTDRRRSLVLHDAAYIVHLQRALDVNSLRPLTSNTDRWASA